MSVTTNEQDEPLTPRPYRQEEQGGEYGSRTAQLEGELEFAREANALLRAELAALHPHADNEVGARQELSVARELIYADSQHANELIARAEAAEQELEQLKAEINRYPNSGWIKKTRLLALMKPTTPPTAGEGEGETETTK